MTFVWRHPKFYKKAKEEVMSRSDMRCEDCKNTTAPDQFACNCLCINCGPCNGECKYEDKKPKTKEG